MKVVCLTESLRSGGAERQLCNIAVGLKRLGWEVALATYAPGGFYSDILTDARVEHVSLRASTRWERFREVRRYLRAGRQDVVLAFLPGASLWAILSGLPARKWALVVSERLALPMRDREQWRAYAYGLADAVTTNSHSNRIILESLNPSLKGKIVTVYNGVDLNHFAPSPKTEPGKPSSPTLLCVGSMVQKKNIANIIRAMHIVRQRRPTLHVTVHWYGSAPKDNQCVREEALGAIDHYGLRGMVQLYETTANIAIIYRKVDALVHPSFYEGLPNAVCEGMASGLPILMSNVCDAGNLVIPGHNGFLFDPRDPNDIAGQIIRFCDLSMEERLILGKNSRARAELLFDQVMFIGKYAELLAWSIKSVKHPIAHWPETVPQTAEEFLEY